MGPEFHPAVFVPVTIPQGMLVLDTLLLLGKPLNFNIKILIISITLLLDIVLYRNKIVRALMLSLMTLVVISISGMCSLDYLLLFSVGTRIFSMS